MLIKKISPSCLNELKKKYNLTHIVMWCKSEEGQYLLSSGDTPDHKVQASLLGNKFRLSLGWPKMTLEVAPKITEALLEIKKLKEENERLKKAISIKEEGDVKPCQGE